jgi:hypothetical protein
MLMVDTNDAPSRRAVAPIVAWPSTPDACSLVRNLRHATIARDSA